MRRLAILTLFLSAYGCEPRTVTDADNTGVNSRDNEGITTKTPLDQNENQLDVDLTARIRKEVMAANLSTNGQNAKIISQDGHVTLRGPVASDDEKKRIEDIARNIAGADKVDSQLEVDTTP